MSKTTKEKEVKEQEKATNLVGITRAHNELVRSHNELVYDLDTFKVETDSKFKTAEEIMGGFSRSNGELITNHNLLVRQVTEEFEAIRDRLEANCADLRSTIESMQADMEKMAKELEEAKNVLYNGDRRPKSERAMTEDDARRVVLGDLAKESVKNAALKIGLSYGQVYSARNGYTFKEIYAELKKRKDDAAKLTAGQGK